MDVVEGRHDGGYVEGGDQLDGVSGGLGEHLFTCGEDDQELEACPALCFDILHWL